MELLSHIIDPRGLKLGNGEGIGVGFVIVGGAVMAGFVIVGGIVTSMVGTGVKRTLGYGVTRATRGDLVGSSVEI